MPVCTSVDIFPIDKKGDLGKGHAYSSNVLHVSENECTVRHDPIPASSKGWQKVTAPTLSPRPATKANGLHTYLHWFSGDLNGQKCNMWIHAITLVQISLYFLGQTMCCWFVRQREVHMTWPWWGWLHRTRDSSSYSDVLLPFKESRS